MNDSVCPFLHFDKIEPARDLEEVWANFAVHLLVNPESEQYVPRTDRAIQKLTRHLVRSSASMQVFLCGHGGSGKTTELNRLCMNAEIREKFFPLYLTVSDFGGESVHLSHDAILLEMGRALNARNVVDDKYKKQIDDWGLQVVKTFLRDETAKTEAGAKAGAWLAFFKAQLGARRQWKHEEKQILEPKVQDLIGILNEMAVDLKNRTGKQLLAVVDDLEKGESEAHKAMHHRLFQEHYDALVQPRFSIVYTLPVYFRALAGSRIPTGDLLSFPAMRIYGSDLRTSSVPPLDKESRGYETMRAFVEKRVADLWKVIENEETLDELIRIGGGLFRETSRVVQEAADFAIDRGADRISACDAEEVFHQVKKDYQPMIRGDAVAVLQEVARTGRWVEGVEPFLQSRAVVEYENHELWLDLRYALKTYVGELNGPSEPGIG